jgi:hypothetical protein
MNVENKILEPISIAPLNELVIKDVEVIYRTTMAGIIRKKLNNGEKIGSYEKRFITEDVNRFSPFETAVEAEGWKIPFDDVLKKYMYKTFDGFFGEAYACGIKYLKEFYGYHKIVKVWKR